MRISTSLHWLVRVVVMALVALTVRSWSGPSADARAKDGCTIHCANGSPVNCGADEHKTWEEPDPALRNAAYEVHSDCKPGSCSYYHPCTSPDRPEATPGPVLDVLTEAVHSTDPQALSNLLKRDLQNVAYNEARHAVQLKDHCGQVIAHLPAFGTFGPPHATPVPNR